MKKAKLISCAFIISLSVPFMMAGCNKHTHNFDLENPIWSWATDNTSATLKFKCLACESFSEDMVDDQIEVHTGTPTCTTGDITTYTANITYNEREFTDVKKVNLDPIGHDFTSLTVSGVKEEGYNALDSISDLTVAKVCSRGHSVIADSSEVVYEYQTDDDFLHYGDTSIRVKIKGTDLYSDVAVKVNKVLVEKPAADTTEFVYNQNTQTYSIPASKYYTVEGNSKVEAGVSLVKVILANKKETSWNDGTTADLEFNFTIAKATPVISGMQESYEMHCGYDLITTGITTNIGTLSVKLYDKDNQEVSLFKIKGGEYTLKATVEGNDNINPAELTAPVICKHDCTWNEINPKADDAKIGNKTGTCKTCGGTVYTPMNHDEINFDWGFGFGASGISSAPSTITNEFPEYENCGRSGIRILGGNNDVQTLKLPRIDYTVFPNISLIYHTNVKDNLYFGLGYAEEDDIISFAFHGNRVMYSFNFKYDSDSETLLCVINDNYGSKYSFVVTDSSVINGTSSLTLKARFGAWRQLALHDILLTHTCSEFIDVDVVTIPGIEKVCSECFAQQAPTVETIVYNRDKIGNKTFEFVVDNSSIKIGKDNSEDVGALKIGGDQVEVTQFNLTLPKFNFEFFNKVTVYFSSNAAGSSIGFDVENKVETISNTKSDNKSEILFEYSDGSLTVTIEIAEGKSVRKVITDTSVISGCKGLTLSCSLNAWHYLAISKMVLNASLD